MARRAGSSTRNRLIILAALLVAATIWLVTRHREVAPPSSVDVLSAANTEEVRDREVTGRRPEASIEKGQTTSGSAETRVAVAPVESPEATPAKPAIAEPKSEAHAEHHPESLWLGGRIVVVDVKGEEHTTENGSIDLNLSARDHTVPIQLAVFKGGFGATVPFCEHLVIDNGVLGEHRAIAKEPERKWSVHEGEELVLNLRWPAATVIHLMDAATGLELQGGTALLGFPGDECARLIPREDRHLRPQDGWGWRVGSASPISLGFDMYSDGSGKFALPQGHCLYVSSEGFAWCKLGFDPKVGGEYFVDLVPGCVLEVVTADVGRNAPTVFRLVSDRDGSIAYERNSDGVSRFTIERIPPGTYRAELRLSASWRAEDPASTRKVTLTADQPGYVELAAPVPGSGARKDK